MIEDPYVEEVHRIRDRMLAECDGDFQMYMDRIRQAQEQDRDRIISKEKGDRPKQSREA